MFKQCSKKRPRRRLGAGRVGTKAISCKTAGKIGVALRGRRSGPRRRLGGLGGARRLGVFLFFLKFKK
ncbi:hypothetical protein C1H46_002620 [Malus baccata]|uniref:Uncharacterized protein n=1 Tax=Malus baccata TaxID=106549 RepID=A0A540NL80_MALBA|nr:hypothetical protein C1H46_002620 [Malus baccata]